MSRTARPDLMKAMPRPMLLAQARSRAWTLGQLEQLQRAENYAVRRGMSGEQNAHKLNFFLDFLLYKKKGKRGSVRLVRSRKDYVALHPSQ